MPELLEQSRSRTPSPSIRARRVQMVKEMAVQRVDLSFEAHVRFSEALERISERAGSQQERLSASRSRRSSEGLPLITNSFSVEERDFAIPLAWEGNRDELHTSDSSAQQQGHPGRLFSGTAGLALAVARAGVEERWGDIAWLSWQFSAPAYLKDTLTTRFAEDGKRVRGTIFNGNTEISSGVLGFEPDQGDTWPSASGAATESTSRTVGRGDHGASLSRFPSGRPYLCRSETSTRDRAIPSPSGPSGPDSLLYLLTGTQGWPRLSS
jgi:hypothetical protein